MSYLDIIVGIAAGGLGSLALWLTIGRSMMLRYAGRSVMRAFAQPSDEMHEAVRGLFRELWLSANEPIIELREKHRTEDGSESEEIRRITPIEAVVRASADLIITKIRGVQGAVARDARRVAESGGLPGIPLPRRGQSTGDFLIEQATLRLMPLVEEKVDNLLRGRGGGGSGRL